MPGTTERSSRDTAPDADSAAVRAMDALRRVVRVLSASARESSRREGVSGAQLFVMRQIAAAPGLSIGELVTRTLSRQSTVSEVVAKLAERGLVVRRASPADARQAALSLTPRGHRLIASAKPTAQEELARGLTMLSAAERSALAQGLDAWLAAAGVAQTPAPMFFEDAEEMSMRRRPVARRASRSK